MPDHYQQVQWSFGHVNGLEGLQDILASRYENKAARVQNNGGHTVALEGSMARLEKDAQKRGINVMTIKESDNSWVVIGDLEKMAHAHLQEPLPLPVSQSMTHSFLEQLKTLKQPQTRDRQ